MPNDDLYSQCLIISSANSHASAFEWMREFGISYAEAVAVMDRMEREGVVEMARNGDTEMAGRARRLL